MIILTDKQNRFGQTRNINGIDITFDENGYADIDNMTDIDALMAYDPSISTADPMPPSSLYETKDLLEKTIAQCEKDLIVINGKIAEIEKSEPATKKEVEKNIPVVIETISPEPKAEESAPETEEKVEEEFDWSNKNQTAIVQFLKDNPKKYPKKEWSKLTGVLKLRKYLDSTVEK
jgi:hypothetical protein